MLAQPVPDFFQEESEAALRLQVQWLEDQIGLGGLFFSNLLATDATAFTRWREEQAALSPHEQLHLRELWEVILHLLSFLNFDEKRVRQLLDHPVPWPPGTSKSPLDPPWTGSSLRAYLEARGPTALGEVSRWVTAFRFGDTSTP